MKHIPSFSLRGKLALVALVLLALPWFGVRYVTEMERLLFEGQEQALLATARAVATALHERPRLLAPAPDHNDALRREAEEELRRLAAEQGTGGPPVTLAREDSLNAGAAQEEISAILRAVQRSSSRIWVVNNRYRVLALAGSLRRPIIDEAPRGALRAAWQDVLGWMIQRPTEDFAESLPDDVLATGRDIAAALLGTPGTRMRRTPDERAIVLSAAHPIWVGNEVGGAVVVEETTNPIQSLKSAALEQLLILTLVSIAGVAGVLLAYASRLSWRIRRLRDEAESAIDARGRITGITSGSGAEDEIGDLSRSFSAVLARLAQHHAYLESMAGRLSHELRTPIAVVRSSLENLKLAPSAEEAKVYIQRAEEGLARLTTILQRMSEASRMEQSLRSAERERYDLAAVVRGCVEGYRQAYPGARFDLSLPGAALEVEGAPDLAAQLLDKLAENAVDFSPPGAPIRVTLRAEGGMARLDTENQGPPLPPELRGRLFESMVSGRERSSGAPHLGLGLYVARLIAEFHGGGIEAENLPGGAGVNLRVAFRLVAG
ncbi:MAG: ATP-binding protein [Betaproteobacteria bacterium]|nr:ATP-binding protein [Betaproteobacteria bacterium]